MVFSKNSKVALLALALGATNISSGFAGPGEEREGAALPTFTSRQLFAFCQGNTDPSLHGKEGELMRAAYSYHKNTIKQLEKNRSQNWPIIAKSILGLAELLQNHPHLTYPGMTTFQSLDYIKELLLQIQGNPAGIDSKHVGYAQRHLDNFLKKRLQFEIFDDANDEEEIIENGTVAAFSSPTVPTHSLNAESYEILSASGKKRKRPAPAAIQKDGEASIPSGTSEEAPQNSTKRPRKQRPRIILDEQQEIAFLAAYENYRGQEFYQELKRTVLTANQADLLITPIDWQQWVRNLKKSLNRRAGGTAVEAKQPPSKPLTDDQLRLISQTHPLAQFQKNNDDYDFVWEILDDEQRARFPQGKDTAKFKRYVEKLASSFSKDVNK